MEKSAEEIVQWLAAVGHEGAHLRLDSRTIERGDIFVAVPGGRVDGRTFIRVAAARGAAGVIMEASDDPAERYPVPSLAVENLARRLGTIAAAYYGDPSEGMAGIAVTGTNGKTTTTHWIADLLSKTGTPCAVLGTVGCSLEGRRFEVPALTTPDAVSLQGIYADIRAAGAKAFALEASSIGLVQGRMTGSHFETAVFTNLTRDHLDYHKTMDAYGEAKAMLFGWPGLRNAVINADDPAGTVMAQAARQNGAVVWATTVEGTVQFEADHVVRAVNVRASEAGTAFTIEADGRVADIHMPQVGRFNVSNLIEAVAAVLARGIALEALLPLIENLSSPPGRMQILKAEGVPLAVVDYSHTPDALEKALQSLRPVAEARNGRLWTVFGCGGDRDAGKRPVMGRVAQTYADEVIVTSDNPRTEEPEAIIADITAGMSRVRTTVDRFEAIREAIAEADARDVILIAGKGHEDYQEVNGVKHHFSDTEAVREAFNDRRVRYLCRQED